MPTTNMLWIVFLTVVLGYKPTVGCGTGYIQHGQSCYHFSTDTENWTGANYACDILGGYLVEVTSQSEDHFLAAQIGLRAANQHFWIGLTDLLEEGTWEWMSSHTVLSSSSYTNWYADNPDNWHDNEDCVYYNNKELQWGDAPCHNTYYYICEMANEPVAVVGR